MERNLTNMETNEQYDDHVWMVVRGEAWAIRSIVRFGPNFMKINMWRGHAPNLEFQKVWVFNPDWESYCTEAAKMLED